MSPLIKLYAAVILIIFLEGFITIFLKSSWFRGKVGEKQAENALKTISKHGIYGKIIKNAYLSKSNGETSELDIVYITAKGLFVLECKNYQGWIFGNEKNQYWTVSLPSRNKRSRKYKFYNPMKQNLSHISPLKEYLQNIYPEKTIPIFPIVVFTERATLKKIEITSDYQPVIYTRELNKHISGVVAENAPILTNVQVDELYEKMKELTKVSKEIKKQHIKDVRLKSVK